MKGDWNLQDWKMTENLKKQGVENAGLENGGLQQYGIITLSGIYSANNLICCRLSNCLS